MRNIIDVAIIGGSYAGLAAALQLGRARRSVVIIDAGQRRNRFASHSHGYLGFDGATPDAIAAAGRANALAYPTVQLREGYVTEIRGHIDELVVKLGTEEIVARRVILATGVVDELPPVPGLTDLWGKRVFHCPYCDGYELDRGPLAVLAVGESSLHQALLVSEWSVEGGTTFLTNGVLELDASQAAQLAAKKIAIERAPVIGVRGTAGRAIVELADRRTLEVAGVFVAPHSRIAEPFASQLGCELEQGPLGAYYKTDPMLKETTVRGVYACGDVGLPMPNVALAVADGTRTGFAVHRSLVFPS